MGRVEDRRLRQLEREAEERVSAAARQMTTDDDAQLLGAYAERALEAIDAGVALPDPTPEEVAAFDRLAVLRARGGRDGAGSNEPIPGEKRSPYRNGCRYGRMHSRHLA